GRPRAGERCDQHGRRRDTDRTSGQRMMKPHCFHAPLPGPAGCRPVEAALRLVARSHSVPAKVRSRCAVGRRAEPPPRFTPVTYLLIHGGGTSARFWDRLLPYLNAPALAVDLPGRNGKPADFATLTVEEEVASVVADVDASGIADPVVVVAHSS